MEILSHAFVLLTAGVIAVPIAHRLGLGSVLGYLLAGIVIGPLLGIVGTEMSQIQEFAEFGVVMMLFLVGLELNPKLLWEMRHKLFGLGGLQVIATTTLFSVFCMLLGLNWHMALAIGMILSLSSTAIVLQTLKEKGWHSSSGGQASFAVLLFQDIAVIFILALLPLLAMPGAHVSGNTHQSILASLPPLLQAITTIAAIAGIVFTGQFIAGKLFRYIAKAHLREIFTAAALMLVIGIALLMEMIGLSPALGTFLAGVVLSGCSFRHELESDIAPFKSLLLGVFFISVGTGIDFHLLASHPLQITSLVFAVLATKASLLFTLGKAFKLNRKNRWLFALGLAQTGEFAFVAFGFAQASGVLPVELVRSLTVVVALSMLITPLLFMIFEKVIAPKAAGDERKADEIPETSKMIIAGLGPFGQIVHRMQVANGCKPIAIGEELSIIENLRKIGFTSYYGDASRPEILNSAGIADAKLLVAALEDSEKQNQLVSYVAKHFPQCKIIACAHHRFHYYELEDAGADKVILKYFDAAVDTGRLAFIEMGMHPLKAERKAKSFHAHSLASLAALKESWKAQAGEFNQDFIEKVRLQLDSLYEVMREDSDELQTDDESDWDQAYT